MGLFDFFKKKPAAEPVVEEQRENSVKALWKSTV